MTKLFLFLILITICSCASEKNSCINEEDINPGGICTMHYDPVCGCNNITYGNTCEAKNAGLTSWEKGECNKGS